MAAEKYFQKTRPRDELRAWWRAGAKIRDLA